MLDELYIIYRPIGCADESATDLEQGEKILFSYPPGRSLGAQLNRLVMLEGLIDFAAKFSSEDIDTALMDEKTWSFFQAEPGLWLIACSSVNSDSTQESGIIHNSNSNGNLFSSGNETVGGANGASTGHSGAKGTVNSKNRSGDKYMDHMKQPFLPSGLSLLDSIIKMFRIYTSLHGEISTYIEHGKCVPKGNIRGEGLLTIDRVQQKRKTVRKLQQKLQQEEYDLIAQREQEQEATADSLDSQGKPEQLNPMRLGLRTQQRSRDDIKQNMQQLSNQVEQLESELSALLQPGQQPEFTPHTVRQRLNEFMGWYLSSGELNRPSALQAMHGMHFCTVGHPAFQGLARVRQSLHDISCGLVLGAVLVYDGQIAWSDLDEESTLILYEILRIQEHNTLRRDVLEYARRLSVGSRITSEVTTTRSAASDGGTSHGERPKMATELGSAPTDPDAWLRHVRGSRGFLTHDWATVDVEDHLQRVLHQNRERRNSSEAAIDQTDHTASKSNEQFSESMALGHDLHVHGQRLWCPSFHIRSAHIAPQLVSKGRMGDVNLARGECTLVGRVVVYRRPNLLLAILLPDWDKSTATKAASSATAGQADTSVTSTPVQDFGSINRDHLQAQHILNMLGSLQRGLLVELDQLHQLLEQPRTQGGSGRHSGTGETSSSATAGSSGKHESTGSTAAPISALANSSSLGATPANGRAKVPIVGQDSSRIVRSLYFNACNRAVKLSGMYRHSLDPAYLWPEPLIRLVAIGKELGSNGDALGQHSSQVGLITPQSLSSICAHYRARFPVSCGLLGSLLESSVVNAFNDAREQMSSTYCASAGQAVEVCLRLSTAQRGGMWVLARRLGDRHLYTVVEGCSTLNELHDSVTTTTDVTFSRVLI